MSHTGTGSVADDYVWSSWRRGFWLYWQHPLIHAGRYLGFMTRRFIPGRVVQFTDGTGNRFVSMKNNFTAMAVAVLGERDPDVMRFLRSWLRPGGVALDVGANIGTYAIPLARLVGARGRVIAFEPNRPTRACLRHNVRLNQLNNILVVSSAVGAVSGQQGLVVTAGNAGEVHLAPRDADHGRTDVRVTTLDEEMSRLGIPAVDYIKLDIEGYELAALRGGDAHSARESTPRDSNRDRAGPSPALRIHARGSCRIFRRPRLPSLRMQRRGDHAGGRSSGGAPRIGLVLGPLAGHFRAIVSQVRLSTTR